MKDAVIERIGMYVLRSLSAKIDGQDDSDGRVRGRIESLFLKLIFRLRETYNTCFNSFF